MKKGFYVYLLEGTYGPILGPLLKSLFSNLDIPQLYRDSISSLGKKGHIVFAQNNKSILDALLLNYRMKEYGLAVPRLIFGHKLTFLQPVGKLWAMIKNHRRNSPFEEDSYLEFMKDSSNASMIFLDEKSDPGQPDPIAELLRLQRNIQIPIYIIPQRIVYRRTYIRTKGGEKKEDTQLGVIKKIQTLARAQIHGFVEHGEPINLQDILDKSASSTQFIEEVAEQIRRELRQHLVSRSSNISGAPIHRRKTMVDKTMKDPSLQSFLRAYSSEHNMPLAQIENKVCKHITKIASDPSPTVINLFSKILTWIFHNIYEGGDVNDEGLKRVREMSDKGAIVYVPCHKSHIDYLFFDLILFRNWMQVPVIATGINLAFFPVGWVLRRGGAFFMKRTFKNNPVYYQSFAAYVRTLLSERVTMGFFIEGGRSRSGKLMLPKMGLLSMILEGWNAGAVNDVIFVPVYMGYDLVLEEDSYVREMKGAQKQKENFLQFIKARKLLKKRYGKVYLRFAPPISMNKYMHNQPSYSGLGQEDKRLFDNRFAKKIISDIYEQTVVTPFSILSSVLMSRTSAIDEKTVQETFNTYLDYISSMGYNMASSFNDSESPFNEALARVLSKGFASIDQGEDEQDPNLIVVDPENRIHLEYYKNNILNCFVPASLISNVLLRYPSGIAEKFFMDEIRGLAGLMENEFILDVDSVKSALQYMVSAHIIMLSQSRYYINPDRKEHAMMFAGLIENYLESYLAVAHNIGKVKGRNKKDILKTINRYASRMYKKGEIKHIEALCLPNYTSAMDTFKAKGVMDSNNIIINEEAMEDLTRDIEAFLED
ncbi:MAG: 1-acyl-sn-glycerol-3-phosphate acyltransferase [Thermodesulfobacteriota bacterium]|nr:1-acyl-sn-glycerol-3-phosphate acyltransferase [Thermodesulfobacteriota bacterium]